VKKDSPGWRRRAAAAAAVVLFYVLIWRPLRTVVASHVAQALFATAGAGPVLAGTHPAVLHVGPEALQWAAPAGLPFVIGAVVIAAAWPRWRPVAGFLAVHVGLGIVSAVAVAAAAHGAAWGPALDGFVTSYLIPGLTLAAMALAVVLPGHSREPQAGPQAAEDSQPAVRQ
jgi:hypothetical protein